MTEPIKVLIVDDLATNRRLHTNILKDLPIVVDSAATASEALEKCNRDGYAALLLDIHLPDMSGFELGRHIQESTLNHHTPVIFVSAVYTNDTDEWRGYLHGAVDYIISPVVPHILRSKIAVFVELTRMRREAEMQARELSITNQALKLANDELEAFSYSVSHDLKAPLRQLHKFAELLQEHQLQQLNSKGQEYLVHIIAAERQMNILINDLLRLSRITRTEVTQIEIDLSTIAREAQNQIQTQHPSWHAAWSIQKDCCGKGDPRLIRIALVNLLENALKYSSKSPSPQIEFGCFNTSLSKAYYVRDNGVGFDLKTAESKLFRPFSRFHKETDYPGTGIGLATTQRIVTKHGGKIWAESEKNQGTTFYFTLE